MRRLPRVAAIVERALASGTIARTVARAVELRVILHVNGEPVPIEVAVDDPA